MTLAFFMAQVLHFFEQFAEDEPLEPILDFPFPFEEPLRSHGFSLFSAAMGVLNPDLNKGF